MKQRKNWHLQDLNTTAVAQQANVLPFYCGTPTLVLKDLKLDGKCRWTTALVSEDVEEVMLGIDQLEANGLVWNFRTGQLCIDRQSAVLHINNYLYILNV